jgi:DNA polymerase-3 subunit chi
VAGTKVDFYVLAAADQRSRLTTVCRLVEKAYEKGLRVAVRTSAPAETVEIDDIMWTYSDRSFVPHGVWPADPDFAAATPVLISSGALPDSHRDVLVNLGADMPADFAAFTRICEVVAADDDAKRRARQRWRGYKDAGLAPENHNL